MFEYIVIILLFWLIVFQQINHKKEIESLEKNRTEILRETVMAIKSKGNSDYLWGLPSVGELPKDNSDEFAEIEEIDPEKLLKSIKGEE